MINSNNRSEHKSQMIFIKECFEENGRVLIDELGMVGFSVNQAIDFLPEAAWSIENLTRIPGAARTINNLPLNDSLKLIDTINMEAIEQKIGLNSDQVKSGFEVIAPFFLKSFSNRKWQNKSDTQLSSIATDHVFNP